MLKHTSVKAVQIDWEFRQHVFWISTAKKQLDWLCLKIVFTILTIKLRQNWGLIHHFQTQPLIVYCWYMGMGQNLVPLVNIKIAGKWMFIPLKMVLIGIDPYPMISHLISHYKTKTIFWPWYIYPFLQFKMVVPSGNLAWLLNMAI